MSMDTKKQAPYYTQTGAAAALGVSRQAVVKAIAAGRLQTIPTVDGFVLVTARSVRAWKGRPRAVEAKTAVVATRSAP